MKIAADNKIPFLRGILEPFAEVVYKPGAAFTAEDVRNADALIIRTRTKCNAALLEHSSVRVIATATIGYDHIDTAYCESRGILWSNAPGCNADSVAQYLAEVLASLNGDLSGKTLGIIGAGHVGKKAAALAEALGMNVLLNDPPRAEAENSSAFVPLEIICRDADIITLHVPLEYAGKYPTFHLANADFFRSCKRKPLFINASRGETADTAAVLEALAAGSIRSAALDVWENEPAINRALLQKAAIATPHIAGYSADGKANGTANAVRVTARALNIPELMDFDVSQINIPAPARPEIILESSGAEALKTAILHTCDHRQICETLRSEPEKFEELRGNYPVRREFQAYTVRGADSGTAAILKKLGFRCL